MRNISKQTRNRIFLSIKFDEINKEIDLELNKIFAEGDLKMKK